MSKKTATNEDLDVDLEANGSDGDGGEIHEDARIKGMVKMEVKLLRGEERGKNTAVQRQSIRSSISKT